MTRQIGHQPIEGGSFSEKVEDWQVEKYCRRGIRVATKQELIDRIYKYFHEVNETPVVYHWKYRMEDFEPSIGVAN